MSTELQDQLLKAIWRQNLPQVQTLLDSGADINGAASKGWTPLMQAVEMENPAFIKLLLDKGANVNHRGSDGVSPLHIAVDISIDGTIQAGRHRGEEPTEIIELLLKHGGSLSAKDVKGRTPLNWALDYHSPKIAGLLMRWQENGGAQQLPAGNAELHDAAEQELRIRRS